MSYISSYVNSFGSLFCKEQILSSATTSVNLAQEIEKEALETTEKEYLELAQAFHNYWSYLLERASFFLYLKTNFTQLLTTKHPEEYKQFSKLLTKVPNSLKLGSLNMRIYSIKPFLVSYIIYYSIIYCSKAASLKKKY